ncbi:MAG: Nif3-like dinuclear metal center hexameric protein [Verrucomicrobiales bacterium]|nr:MAG: Nif3-like dinuclear metal center hexameric protein [Verrucomicrobiales bacterium]
MPQTSLSTLVAHTDKILNTAGVGDYDGAVNGLQVENSGRVTRIAATVDASLATVRLAIKAKADLLIVHHGLFWSPAYPWTGRKHELIRALIENNIAVYSSHLPLDAHPTLGNNARLCAALGFKKLRPFFPSHGQTIGFQTATNISRDELAVRLARVTGAKPRVIPGGPKMCRRIGVVTGGAGDDLKTAVAGGVDTFITGEGPHWTYALAEELGINVLYGGHYATETFGVKALAAHLSKKFRVPWIFLDHPTGL